MVRTLRFVQIEASRVVAAFSIRSQLSIRRERTVSTQNQFASELPEPKNNLSAYNFQKKDKKITRRTLTPPARECRPIE